MLLAVPVGNEAWADWEPSDLGQSQTGNIISLRMHPKPLSQWVKEAGEGHK